MISLSSHVKYLVGIDEAGRGPLAGPVAVGAVVIDREMYFRLSSENLIPERGIDSKALSEERREQWYERLFALQKEGSLFFDVRMVSHSVIDRYGIQRAVRLGISRLLQNISPHNSYTFLDGLLRAHPSYPQQTIVAGDTHVPLISLASIVAKVERDRRMRRYAKHFPDYGFEVHKGYATRQHRENIRQHGPCRLHRRSFLKRIDKYT